MKFPTLWKRFTTFLVGNLFQRVGNLFVVTLPLSTTVARPSHAFARGRTHTRGTPHVFVLDKGQQGDGWHVGDGRHEDCDGRHGRRHDNHGKNGAMGRRNALISRLIGAARGGGGVQQGGCSLTPPAAAGNIIGASSTTTTPPPQSPQSPSQRPPPLLPCFPLERHHLGSLAGWSSSRRALVGGGIGSGTEEAAATDGGHRRRSCSYSSDAAVATLSNFHSYLCDRIGRTRDRVILASLYVGVGSGTYDDEDDGGGGDGTTGCREDKLLRRSVSQTGAEGGVGHEGRGAIPREGGCILGHRPAAKASP